MSYNIIKSHTKECEVYISWSRLMEAFGEYDRIKKKKKFSLYPAEDGSIDGVFVKDDDLLKKYSSILITNDDKLAKITDVSIRLSWSGEIYGILIDLLDKYGNGILKGKFVWEDGDIDKVNLRFGLEDDK